MGATKGKIEQLLKKVEEYKKIVALARNELRDLISEADGLIESWDAGLEGLEAKMFSVRQKRKIADKVQKILRETNNSELPVGEIGFLLHVDGAESSSWADIRNNMAVADPVINPHSKFTDSDK